MLIILKKTYTITVTIQEGNDEFWESLAGKAGCDQVVSEVEAALEQAGFIHLNVRLAKFSEEPLHD